MPTSRWAARSASGCRSATAGRTPLTSPPTTSTGAPCRAGSSASRWTAAGARRSGSRCRPASSTSGARRRPATSARRRLLLGVIAGMYAVYHGPEGLTQIARRVHRLTDILAVGLQRLGFAIESESWFDTLTVHAPGAAEAILKRAEEAGYNLRPIDGDRLGIACDETTTRADIEAVMARVRRRRARLRRRLAGRQGPVRTAAGPGPADCLPQSPGVQPLPRRDRAAALHAAPRGPGPHAQPGHDPPRLLHHETQRDRRDDADHLAGLRRDPSLRPRRASGGLPRARLRPGADAERGHGFCGGLAAAQRRQPGRVRRAPGDPPLSREPRRRRTQRLSEFRAPPTAPIRRAP